jgi:hypothetical protein
VLVPEQSATFSGRMELIAREHDADRRALLIDSLVLDLGTHVASARAWSAQFTELENARSLLEGNAGDRSECASRAHQVAMATRQVEAVAALVAAARAFADREARRRASAARRRAVLDGLAPWVTRSASTWKPRGHRKGG